ncbi:MAG: ImmA/IrrE family metallo-endopeptidase [Bacteroidales bacterium]|nr:ImmA/IrrE family metallo-endopeptidase [Bacteroidales bacterium]
MTEEELLYIINKDLKKHVPRDEIFSDRIDPVNLKRIDKVFNKGLHYYLDPKSPEPSRDASIFFRKTEFETDLNIGARKIVNHFEEFKISLSALAKLADLNIERTIPTYNLNHDPKSVAEELRKFLYPGLHSKQRDFLKNLITKLAEANILVFEFVEAPRKKERANIDGVFLTPNVIVLKRNQGAFSREIFTLAHELGHYLLGIEEIEEINDTNFVDQVLSSVEQWCNDFAYHFLIGKLDDEIEKIEIADGSNDYCFDIIDKISDITNLSRLALFTRLLLKHKISASNYRLVKSELDARYKEKKEAERRKRELEKLEGKIQGGSIAKPIYSPLLVTTIQTAFYEGLINEYEACKSLNISPVKLESFFK